VPAARCAAPPYRQLILHVDFQRVDATHKLHQKVPLHFINADIAPGVKLGGGMVSHVMNELDVKCLPSRPADLHRSRPQGPRPPASRSTSPNLLPPKGVEIVHCTAKATRWWPPSS
jgi:large subunit ribosomal protein L25